MIRKEMILCRADFSYWVSRYAFIKSDEGSVLRMVPWVSQQIFLSILAEMQEQEISLMLIILKARQLGLSRIISLILWHAVLLKAHTKAFLASSTEDKTGLLFETLDFLPAPVQDAPHLLSAERQNLTCQPFDLHQGQN